MATVRGSLIRKRVLPARLGLHLDLAAEAADAGAHDVHADPRPAAVVTGSRGGEAGQEDQVHDVALAEPGDRLGRHESSRGAPPSLTASRSMPVPSSATSM